MSKATTVKTQLLTTAHVALPAGILYFIKGDYAKASKYFKLAIDARNIVVNDFHDGVRDYNHTRFQLAMCGEVNRMMTHIERKYTRAFRFTDSVVVNEVLNNGVEIPAEMLPDGFVRVVRQIRPDYRRAFEAEVATVRPAVTERRPESPADLNARLREKLAAIAATKREEELRRRIREAMAARTASVEISVQS
jgi:hypothetical protein